MRIWQKILIILSLPILFEIVFVVLLTAFINLADSASDQFEHTKNVLVRFSRAQLVLFGAISNLDREKDDSSMTGQFAAMSRSIDDWETVTKHESDVRPELREAMAEDPEVFDHVRQVLSKAKKVYMDPGVSFNSKSDYIKKDFFALMLELKPLLSQMQSVDDRLHVTAPEEIQKMWLRIALFVGFFLVFNTVMSILVALILFKDIVGRIDTIQENAHRVARGVELLPVAQSDDEIADLDKAFHNAADIITDARRKEFAILEKSVNVLFSLDRGLRFTAIGDSCRKVWHYQPGDLRARSFLSVVPEGYVKLAKHVFEITAAAGKEQQFDGQIICGDQSVRDVHFTVVWQAEGKVFHCVAHDITERREVERHKQELIAIAGSALDSPLSAVSDTLSGLASENEEAMNETVKNMLQRAIGNLQRLTRLIGDLLDIEQMDSGKIVLNCDRVDAKAICVSAIDAVNALANRLGVKVVAPEETAELLADRRRVEQILVNLISNAIKFSPKGEAVLIGIEKLQDVVELSVSDHGPGIDVAEQKLIFDRFYQAKTKSDAAIKSTGLGLTICKVLVEAHSGQIGVDGAPGQGSRFWIRLPAFAEDSGEVLKLKLANKGLLVIFVPLFCQILLSAILVVMLFQAKEELTQHAHTDAIYYGCNDVIKGLASSSTVESVFTGLQWDVRDSETIRQQLKNFKDGVEGLKEEVASQPFDNSKLLDRLTSSAQTCEAIMSQTYQALRSGGTAALSANNMERSGFNSAADLVYALDGICQHEMELEEQREGERRVRDTALRQIVSALTGLGLSVAAAIWCISHIRNRLKTLQENTRRFARRQPLLAAANGTDELAALDHVFHVLDMSIDEVAERERALIDNAAELICSVDRDAIFERVNSFSMTLLGRSPEALIGAPVLDVVTKDDVVKANDEFNIASAHEGVHSFELQLQPLDKDAVDTSWSTFWSERDRSLFCVVSDVTERNKIERLKEDFVAMISHDLRTPLMSLSIDISLLMRAADRLSSGATEQLVEAEATVQQLIHFVNDLLDFEKLQAGKMQFFKELISADSLVVNAAADLYDQAQPRNIEVSVVSNCLRTVQGDREKLAQLVTNILANALARSPDGGKIRVGSRSDETTIFVEVTDEGASLLPESAEKIFMPFSQGVPGSSRESGLELVICKLIVEGHGGAVGVRQSENDTTCFWFSLPISAAVADDDML